MVKDMNSPFRSNTTSLFNWNVGHRIVLSHDGKKRVLSQTESSSRPIKETKCVSESLGATVFDRGLLEDHQSNDVGPF